jgi:hypothetical protein
MYVLHMHPCGAEQLPFGQTMAWDSLVTAQVDPYQESGRGVVQGALYIHSPPGDFGPNLVLNVQSYCV